MIKESYYREYRKKYYPKHKQVIKDYALQYRLIYPKKHNIYVEVWRQRNPEKYKQICRDAAKKNYIKNREQLLMYDQFKRLMKKDELFD